MSFLSKVGNILGRASDWASNIIKPIKNHVTQGLTKAGNWLDRNHETIGTIASGIGSILQNLPSSKMKDKLESYGNTLSSVGNTFLQDRPTNLARKAVSEFMNNQHTQQNYQQQNRPYPQTPAIQPVNHPIEQPIQQVSRQSTQQFRTGTSNRRSGNPVRRSVI